MTLDENWIAKFVEQYAELTGASPERAREVFNLNWRGIQAWADKGHTVEWIAHEAATYNLELPPHRRRKGCRG